VITTADASAYIGQVVTVTAAVIAYVKAHRTSRQVDSHAQWHDSEVAPQTIEEQLQQLVRVQSLLNTLQHPPSEKETPP